MVQNINPLDILYGNCARISRATELLFNRCSSELTDLGCFTEVVSRQVYANCYQENVINSTDSTCCALLCRDSDGFEFRSSFKIGPNWIVVKTLWCNFRLLLVLTYLSPNQNRLSAEAFQSIIPSIFHLRDSHPKDVLMLVIGDFNSYHPSWSRENYQS